MCSSSCLPDLGWAACSWSKVALTSKPLFRRCDFQGATANAPELITFGSRFRICSHFRRQKIANAPVSSAKRAFQDSQNQHFRQIHSKRSFCDIALRFWQFASREPKKSDRCAICQKCLHIALRFKKHFSLHYNLVDLAFRSAPHRLRAGS